MVEVEEVSNKMQAQMRLHPAAAEEEDDADLPLPALFDKASHLHSLASSSSLDQEGIRKGVDLLRRCDEMVSKLGLFSSNETKDDVSTANLKYLLVPYYLGEMTEKVAQEDRIPVLKSSQDHLKEFIYICEALELISEDELELSRQKQPDTMANRRAQKVARFKRQKAAETKLLEIKERKERRRRSLRAAALSAPIEAGEEDAFEDDGEEEREAWLATISLALCKAFDLLDMLKKEEEMLLAVKERKTKDGNAFAREMLDERTKRAEAWHHNAANRAPYSKPADPITCATFAQDVIEGRASVSQAHEHKHQPLIFGPASLVGGRLTSERERMAAQVFQPSYRLPTMSIEEAGLREMKMMEKWQERTAKMIQESNSAWHKDGSRSAQEDEDAEEEKARAWDDWKDDNPRGAGNKKLTPYLHNFLSTPASCSSTVNGHPTNSAKRLNRPSVSAASSS
uniref:PP2A regulatory subunit TAP46 n=2 Tax=Oryza meridionalis TaxID=40149 RepID=A0A0E0F962_9ORYZ